jgi:hypothetical protein
VPTAALACKDEDLTYALLVSAAAPVAPLAAKPYALAETGPLPRGPALFVPDATAAERFFDFFASNIRNKNTRRAYYRAACAFSAWSEGRGLHTLAAVKPFHVAAYIEGMAGAKPTVKQHLAALRAQARRPHGPHARP